ncbi:iron-containing alcohol dehydrogenase [uncultured Oscillibacter sp.]|uniref:iron-containing alcohol dehydrogenase n=1 Tax=uncultured Oscillibacter sp. TaxID=876091 RepID=UPI00262A4E93|nr:iron-containing alcohol dehydrogenase [uncultured Oscillibacter sp.]
MTHTIIQTLEPDSFTAAGCGCVFDAFNGECCMSENRRLVELVQETGCAVIVGVGGGKIFDTAKAVAYYADQPVVICPTVASTDVSCSALSVIYTEEDAFEEHLFLKRNPDVVLVDTAVITAALAKLCFDTLMADGLEAQKTLEQKRCTDAVEHVIESNTLLSGLGFESGGLAGAHAIHNGLTVLEECRHMNHGEKVAFGTLAQLVPEQADAAELERVVKWCVNLGLPVTLGELGVTEVTPEKAMQAAEAACAPNDTIGNPPFTATPQMVCEAILKADTLGRKMLEERKS